VIFPIPDRCGPLLRMQVVVAHPDDETFGCGSLLLRAAQLGAVTAVTCATRGEAGEVRPGVEVPAGGVGALREGELREAAGLLGVRRVDVLGFRDSGMEGEPAPDALVLADEAQVRSAVEAAVDAFRPNVLVSLDASDGHRDHARMRDVTVAVADDRGLPVYLQCLPRSTMRRWAEHMATVDPELAYLRLGELGTPDEEISVVLDTTVHLEQRWRAIRTHRSQGSPFDGLPDDLARAFLTREHLLAVS
jgi:N-acetyl-1-D-myo-inositol-2-amino-2-deoxy-alpha-D-glucopyranoside deacetylase